jgi:hypothetical protein
MESNSKILAVNSNTILNYYLYKKFKFIRRNKFNNLIDKKKLLTRSYLTCFNWLSP